ncbi:hypothetical protein ACQP2Y_26835 [Actinoplanes sp. CA-051413]|uniref:hypothetical protein n=1 Tax=Actinoplanes sp. CA-051413 TaxID=3239899 RepID=UPI003D98E304
MHGIPDAGSTDRSPQRPPPDWPEPGTPLAGEEPTVELPVVTEAMLAATSTPTLAGAALSLALNKSSRARRIPALERRGPRPAPARQASLNDLLTGPNNPVGPTPSAPPSDGVRLDDGGGEEQHSPAALAGGHPVSGGEPAQPGRGWLVGAGIAAAALLLTGAAVVALSRDGDPGATPSGWSPPVAAAPSAPHLATAARDGRTSAGFDLIDGAERVTLRAADLGDTLYRITTPDAGAVVPRTDEQDGRVRLRLDGDAESVDITLNAAVRWDLRIAGGAQVSTIDLSAGRVGGVDLTGGASRIALTLPRPDGTLSVRMSGGVSLFDVHTAERTPVRVRVGRGAGQVTLDGQRHAGVAAGQTFTPASWAAAVDRVDVDAAAGMSSLTVAPY